MKSGDTVIGKTSFIYEDGNTYYFDIKSHGSTIYHDLYVYKKIEVEKKVRVGTTFFFIPEYEMKMVANYERLNDHAAAVETALKVDDIKKKIKDVIMANTCFKIQGWDGIVGNVPDHLKDRLTRDNKLSDILDDMIDEE